MQLTIWLKPTSNHKVSPDATYDAQDTGDWASSDYSNVDDPQGAPDALASYNAHTWGPPGGYATRYRFVSYGFEPPPPGITINKVTLHALVTNACSNNQPVDGDARLLVIANAGANRYLGSANTIYGLTANQFLNDQEWREISHPWLVNPFTGLAWTLADLTTVKGGVRTVALTDPTPSNQPTFYLTWLGLEIDANSTAGNIEQIRRIGSWNMLVRRKPLRTGEQRVPIQHGDRGLLKPIWLADKAMPAPDGKGSDVEAVRRAPQIIVGRTCHVGTFDFDMKYLDPRLFAVTEWETGVTTLGADVNDIGIARWDRGGGRTFARAQTGYAKRPDGLWVDRAADTPRYHKDYGLLITAGQNRSSILHNTFDAYGGGAFTGWAATVNGTGVFAQDTGDYLFDVSGLRSSARISNGAAGYVYLRQGWDGWPAGLRHITGFKGKGTLANPMMLLRLYSPNRGAPATIYDYNFATDAWAASANLWFAPPGAVGEIFDFWSKSAAIPAGGDIDLFVGYEPTANNVTHLYAAGVWHDQAAATGMLFPREWHVLTTVEGAPVPDSYYLNNDAAFRVWDFARGAAHLRFTPLWCHAEMVDAVQKVVLEAYGQAGHYDRIAYVRDSSTAGRWIFTRVVGGATVATASLATSGATLPARLQTYKIAVRWTSTLGELGLASRTLSIFVNGTKGTSAAAASEPTPVDGTTKIWIGRENSGLWYQYGDGYMKHRMLRAWCPPDETLVRMAS